MTIGSWKGFLNCLQFLGLGIVFLLTYILSTVLIHYMNVSIIYNDCMLLVQTIFQSFPSASMKTKSVHFTQFRNPGHVHEKENIGHPKQDNSVTNSIKVQIRFECFNLFYNCFNISFSMWNGNMHVVFALNFSVFPHTLCSCRGVRLSVFSRLACHSFCWCDCCHLLFIEQHSMYVLWTVCLCFSEGMCSEYAVLAFQRPFKRVKQEIKALLKPQLCCQDAVTDLTANKTGLLRLNISNYQSGLAFTERWAYFLFYFATDVSHSVAKMHIIVVTTATLN